MWVMLPSGLFVCIERGVRCRFLSCLLSPHPFLRKGAALVYTLLFTYTPHNLRQRCWWMFCLIAKFQAKCLPLCV